MASGANHSLWYVEQIDPNLMPVAPAFKEFPLTGTTLNVTRDSIVSERLGSQHVHCVRLGNKTVGGGGDFELTYGDLDDMIAAVFQSSWTPDADDDDRDNIEIDVTTRRNFLFARQFEDMAANAQFLYYMGCEINSFNISVAPNSNVTGSIEIVGVTDNVKIDGIAGATYAPASSNCPFDGFTGFLKVGDVDIAYVTQIDLTINRNITANFALFGNKGAYNKNVGKINVTGTLTLYFETLEFYQMYQNEVSTKLALELQSAAGTLGFEIPNLKFTGGQPDVSDDGAITIALEFSGLYDAEDGHEVMAYRIAA